VRKKLRIGELLVENGVINREQLDQALKVQRERGRRLGRTLIDLGYLAEGELLSFLSRQLEIPLIDLARYQLTRETVVRLPETHARRFRALIVEDTGKDFLLAMADPADLFAVDELSRILDRPLRLAVARESDILRTIDRLYRRTEEISHIAEELRDDLAGDESPIEGLDSGDASDAPVMRLLRSVFEDAVQVRASDVHIEPDEGILRIRQRVDGVLQEHVMKEPRIGAAVALRLKLTAGLDISEKRLPQDGRFQIAVQGKTLDVRISTMPVQHGESVVMRLLDSSSAALGLDELGMPEAMVARLRHWIHRPHGLVLVTGPTGSGKTTTLYAALRELNTAERKIFTVEDPVEYRLGRINQVQVHSQIGLTFARVLRSALRHDPDVLMIGEMRDQETAEIGLRASITGHLVLSTLHTNDAVTSGPRLVDMGAQGYLAAAALRAVVAQRLVRRICDHCREPYTPEPQERVWLRGIEGDATKGLEYSRGRGCTNCNGTGYRGRIGVYELLELDAEMADALRRSDSAGYARAARALPGFRPLVRCTLDYAAAGITTLSEVFRVAEQIEEPQPSAPTSATAAG
jgi:MSHA biogenesis protein MshE